MSWGFHACPPTRRPNSRDPFRDTPAYLDLAEEQYIRRHRFPKVVFSEIHDILYKDLLPCSQAQTALSAEVKVTLTLNFLPTGTSQAAAADLGKSPIRLLTATSERSPGAEITSSTFISMRASAASKLFVSELSSVQENVSYFERHANLVSQFSLN